MSDASKTEMKQKKMGRTDGHLIIGLMVVFMLGGLLSDYPLTVLVPLPIGLWMLAEVDWRKP